MATSTSSPSLIDIREASIATLSTALTTHTTTSVDLAAAYLARLARFDARGNPPLTSTPILSRTLFSSAAASDSRRAAGIALGPLDGIPYTVKDSYRVRGETVAAGSPAFTELVADNDAYTVARLRAHGAVLIGRTNMPPMAYGGMQRGVYGRAESPYNPSYLPAAWSSGSSNGSAVATTSSFAAFGMAEETVSSGRSPASNNALVAYTPSRGWLSVRGNWPLYPTCDVVVPHTRSVPDMLMVLEAIADEPDPVREGDFWREQPWIPLIPPWGGRKPELCKWLASVRDLEGVRIAVPSMYIGGDAPTGATPVHTHPDVITLWREARQVLESLGATIIEVPDFPAVTAYEHPELLPEGLNSLPENWPQIERGPLVAFSWDTFLQQTGNNKIPNLSAVPDEHGIFPMSMRTPAELRNLPLDTQIHWGHLANYVKSMGSIYATENLKTSLETLEKMRKVLFEDFLKEIHADCLVFPAAGDVAEEDSDIHPDKADFAWRNGVLYSNGNRPLRHLGIPTVTVPMGEMPSKRIPVGLTFAGAAGSDEWLLGWAGVFDGRRRGRTEPKGAGGLPTDMLERRGDGGPRKGRPEVAVDAVETQDAGGDKLKVAISGRVIAEQVENPIVEVMLQGIPVPPTSIDVSRQKNGTWCFRAEGLAEKPRVFDKRERTMVPVSRDKTMVVVLARRDEGGYPAGCLELV